MKKHNLRILVIGAGVNGSVCAAHLHNHGIDVTLLARGKRVDQIKQDGIIIENPFNNRRMIAKVNVIDVLRPDDIYDYVLVVVRRNQVTDLLPVLAANASPNVVFMSNNLLGPEEMTRALGAEKVLLGFVFAGGKKDASIVRAIGPTRRMAPFGEIGGNVTPRIKTLVRVLNRAGLRSQVSMEIVDWLATHAAGVAILGPMVMKYHNDVKALARSTADLRLIVTAIRETHLALDALGHKIVPASQRLAARLPGFVVVMMLRWLLRSRLGEVGAAWHVSQAPDEMQALASDLRALVVRSGLSVPAVKNVLGMT